MEGVAFIVGMVAGGILATMITIAATREALPNFQKSAIRAGVAEYYLDSEHSRQFRFYTNGSKLP